MKKILMKLTVCMLLFCFIMPVSAAQKEVIKGDTIHLFVGKSKTVSFKKLVKNGGTVKVKVSNKKVVKLEKKKTSVVITGKRSGTATLTISAGNKKYVCKIKVKKKADKNGDNKTDTKKIALSETDVTMHVGDEKEILVLNYDRIIAEYEDKSLQFDIDNANVIKFGKVKEGSAIIKAVGKGKAVLTIKTSKEVFTCNVTVN